MTTRVIDALVTRAPARRSPATRRSLSGIADPTPTAVIVVVVTLVPLVIPFWMDSWNDLFAPLM